MSQVLVTGGNGFIGVHILNILLERGHSVVTTVRSESKTSFLRHKFITYGVKLKFAIVPDLTKPGAFDDVLTSYKFDAVLHTSSPFTFEV
jgi:nucleoside-diphosphate-sugar epimerase